MLTGEPSHYRNISRAEVLDKLTRSKSLCRVATKIVLEEDMACNNECGRWDGSNSLPFLPSPPQLSTLGALIDIEDTLHLKQKDAQPLVERLQIFVLAKRTKQKLVKRLAYTSR